MEEKKYKRTTVTAALPMPMEAYTLVTLQVYMCRQTST